MFNVNPWLTLFDGSVAIFLGWLCARKGFRRPYKAEDWPFQLLGAVWLVGAALVIWKLPIFRWLGPSIL